jgi:hypothetical protein
MQTSVDSLCKSCAPPFACTRLKKKLRCAGLDGAQDSEKMNSPYQDEEGWLRPRKEQPHATSRYLGT